MSTTIHTLLGVTEHSNSNELKSKYEHNAVGALRNLKLTLDREKGKNPQGTLCNLSGNLRMPGS